MAATTPAVAATTTTPAVAAAATLTVAFINGRRRHHPNRSKEETRISDLPCEILIDIISNLPINTIKICSRVCKEWHNLIFKNPQFIKLHSSKSLECFLVRPNIRCGQVYLVDPEEQEAFPTCTTAITTTNYEPVRDHDIIFEYDFRSPRDDLKFVNSCNGFICLMLNYNEESPIYILNPMIGEYVRVVQPPLQPEFYLSVITRFGYILRTNEFKLVLFQFNPSGSEVSKIAILTLGTEKWRTVDCVTLRSYNLPHTEAFLNGCLHWIIRSNDRSAHDLIACFNYDDEQLKVVPPPLLILKPSFIIDRDSTSLGVINGCLSICVCRNKAEHIEIFVMKEYGVQESWTKLVHFWYYRNRYQPFRLSNNGRTLIFYNGRSLAYGCECLEVSRIKYIHGGNFLKFEIYKMNDFQVVLYTPSFLSFKDIAMGDNLKIFRMY